MTAYSWPSEIKPLYEKAVELYRQGQRGDHTYFSTEEVGLLASIGLRPINVYDAAEDFVGAGEPTWETFLLVAGVRRDYFLYIQRGASAVQEIAAAELPPKTEAFDGVEWLPRIIRKAQCYLEGGLCHDIMYGCGGDRRFLRQFDTHPADFLRIVWEAKADPARVLSRIRP